MGKWLKSKWKKYKLYLIAAAVSAAAAISVYSGMFGTADINVSDQLYQQEQAPDRRIVLLGIDDEALDYFGPIATWTRDIYGEALDYLYADETAKPFAVGLDILFSGETDEDKDAYLAQSCEGRDNIVMATWAELGSEVVVENENSFYTNDFHVENYAEPYPALKSVSRQGFINNMLGEDGIARNGLLRMRLPDGTVVDSFTYTLYKLYAKANGLEENLEDRLPMNEHYQFYVPFIAGPGKYEEYPLSSLFTGELAGDELDGCIVLIGPYSEGLQDSFVTAVDHSRKMNGVEIHANILDALINGNYKAYVPELLQCLILFFLLFASILFFMNSRVWQSALAWAIITFGYIGAAKLFYEFGYILHVIYIPICITALFVIEVGANYVKATMEKHLVENTFRRYVAPQVVDEIFKENMDNLGLGGKMTDIACLFVDIRGFTTMAEHLEPPQVVEILNSYLSLTSRCIMDNGGTLDKFIGDATMAIFNTPLPQQDYIYQAVKTACDMVDGSVELGRQMEEKYGKAVSFGVGVHCGKAVVGNIGTKMRMDYTAIGDTVNTASRLESVAKAGQVLISRTVYEALEGRIEAVSLGTGIKLKGKSDGFEIFAVERLL